MYCNYYTHIFNKCTKFSLHFTPVINFSLIVHNCHFFLVTLSVAGVVQGVGGPSPWAPAGVAVQGSGLNAISWLRNKTSLIAHWNEKPSKCAHMTYNTFYSGYQDTYFAFSKRYFKDLKKWLKTFQHYLIFFPSKLKSSLQNIKKYWWPKLSL